MASILRPDLVPSKDSREEARIIFQQLADASSQDLSIPGRLKTPESAKNIYDFSDLVRQAVEDKENKEGIVEENRVNFTEEIAKVSFETETISFSLVRREPGIFGRGKPMEGKVHGIKPLMREQLEDPVYPGYKRSIFGYYYDNVMRFICWATTNKTANARSIWFEKLMFEYTWFFQRSGINRIIYYGRSEDIIRNEENTILYGRPIDYYVRDELITIVDEKTIEQLIMKYDLQGG